MDSIVISVYRNLLRTHGCSTDDVLETPELRSEYLAAVRRLLGDLPEQMLLHRLTALRKKSKLPRRSDLTAPATDAIAHDTTDNTPSATVS